MADIIRLADAQPHEAPSLPQNVEAEAALLGALMIDNRLAEDIQLKLRPDHFFEPLHARIYENILKLVDRNMIASPVTLRPLFEADQEMKELGGPSYLAQLTGSGAAIIGARDFAEQIYELALLRALIGVGREMVEQALDTSEDVDPKGQIEQAEAALYRVAEEGGGEGSVKTFAQATRLAVQMAEKALNTGGGLSGITTGLDSVNAKTGGLHHSDLLILAGRPGMGKTALATNIAFNAAQRLIRDIEDGIAPEKSAGAGVAFFSLEMSADQLATRILAEQSGSARKTCAWARSASRISATSPAPQPSSKACRSISTTRPASPSRRCRTRARRLKRQKGIGFIVVDYLQLLQGTGKNSNENRVNEISEISRGLKTLAKELNVPVSPLAAEPRRRAARKQAPSAVGSARIRVDRAGRRYRAVRLSRGILRPVARAEAADGGRRFEDLRSARSLGARHGARLWPGRADHCQAAPRRHRQGEDEVRAKITRFSDHIEDDYLPEARG
jgi:replicative DNA helicase